MNRILHFALLLLFVRVVEIVQKLSFSQQIETPMQIISQLLNIMKYTSDSTTLHAVEFITSLMYAQAPADRCMNFLDIGENAHVENGLRKK